jgi:hypothetical protein
MQIMIRLHILITAHIILVFWDINWQEGTSTSEECAASIFNAENYHPAAGLCSKH